MFCDFYNPSQHTYCKRLRVLCPEHFKDSTVISESEVYLYPLNTFGFKYIFIILLISYIKLKNIFIQILKSFIKLKC